MGKDSEIPEVPITQARRCGLCHKFGHRRTTCPALARDLLNPKKPEKPSNIEEPVIVQLTKADIQAVYDLAIEMTGCTSYWDEDIRGVDQGLALALNRFRKHFGLTGKEVE